MFAASALLAVLKSEIGRTTPGAVRIDAQMARRDRRGVRHMQLQGKVAALVCGIDSLRRPS
ncbi:MAG TPA: hypothetical protein VJ777_32375 [Mycobacterium sp.]|nr:hypothetical protein [Mycobacterium sp.]